MRAVGWASACLWAFSALTSAGEIPADHILWGEKGPLGDLVKRQATSTTSRVADPACTNGPLTRSCWTPGFSVATDFDAKWPDTGRTVTANLEITNTTCNPDGHGERVCLLFNNQYPGPTIVANWGDTISVTVKNSMQSNGTGVHWHGVRQLNTNSQDGVGGITECPLAPGDTKTYTFKATQFGTSWFHSHFSTQYGDGAAGQLIINGPASANYDYDLGAYPITDWYYNTAFQIEDAFNSALQAGGPGPGGDNILVNGTARSSGGGKYSSVQLTKGKKYRLRLINTSVDNNIYVSLDNHPFTVINNDFVSIKPFTTNWLLMAVGQRYDVIITADQTVGNYWFRAEAATGCASTNSGFGRGIFSYAGAPSGDPTSSGGSQPGDCNEPYPTPFAPNNVPSDTFLSQVKSLDVDLKIANVTTNGKNIVYWGVNMTAIDISWDQPTLQLVADGNTSYPQTYNLLELPTEGIWTYWIIQEVPSTKVLIPHPIHLHGHDFLILGASGGQFDINSSPNSFRWTNPTRRDVVLLPAGGWVAIAFLTDNPGAWLMHCHISWHISEGLGVQFLESKSSIGIPGDFQNTCDKWDSYARSSSNVWPKQDSGL